MTSRASFEKRREGGSSAGRRSLEAPSTPGRTFFSFSAGIPSRKTIPSKWEDAEKWLISSPCHESHAHNLKPSDPSKFSPQNDDPCQKGAAFLEKLRATEEKVAVFHGPLVVPLDSDIGLHGVSAQVLLKDRFTDNAEHTKASFSYREVVKDDTTEVVAEVRRRDIGTDMTPLGSSATSRCHTPIKSSSPARHNTPSKRFGSSTPPKRSIDISELQDCHFAKLQLSAQYGSITSKWSSREEEEEEVSKSLRHSETGNGGNSFVQSRASLWEDEERSKSCMRYQREEARIQAWLNLENAKAEAESRKLEVKIQKMRSNLEEKLMKRMAIVQRRAEEWRAAAHLQHSQQVLRASEQAQRMRSQGLSQLYDNAACGCFPL